MLVIIGVLQYILFDVCFHIYWILEYDYRSNVALVFGADYNFDTLGDSTGNIPRTS